MQSLKKITFIVQVILTLAMLISVSLIMYFIAQSSLKRMNLSVKTQHSFTVNTLNGYLGLYNEEHKKKLSTFFSRTDSHTLLKKRQKTFSLENVIPLLEQRQKKLFLKNLVPLFNNHKLLDEGLLAVRVLLKDSTLFSQVGSDKILSNKQEIEDTLVKLAIQTKEIQIGFELHNSDYYYKIVFPLFDNDTFLGVSEFSYSVKSIIDDLHRQFGLDVAFVYKKHLQPKSKYIVSYATNETFYEITSDLHLIKKRFTNITANEKQYSIYKYKLQDRQNNAKMVSFYDTTYTNEKRQATLYKLLSILLFIALSLVIFINLVIKYFVKTIQDKEAESLAKSEELYFKSRHNNLSKLPNMNIYNEDINTNEDYSILLLNMDNLSILNTSYGSKNVNSLIVETAKHLNSNLPNNAQIYHIGIDEFIIVLSKPLKDQEEALALQIKAYFGQTSIEVDDIATHVNFSIGIATHDPKKEDTLNIFSQASVALVEAKSRGKGLILHYDISMNNLRSYAQLAKNIAILQEDLEDDKLLPFYQAIVDTKTKEILKYEALARIEDEDGNIISPFHFMQAAEVSGLQCSITRQMIQKSFIYFEATSTQFSINITKLDFLENYLIDFLTSKTITHNIDPKNVTLEILEDIVIENSPDLVSQINHLASLGYVIAIDDFGVESSNMSKLSSLSADFVKIDGSFIKDIYTNKTHLHIVESIVHVAKSLGIKIIAEYVHNEEVYKVMKELDVDYCQGYYFSEPKKTI